MDQLAEAGVVGEEEGTKPRKILMSMEEFEEFRWSGVLKPAAVEIEMAACCGSRRSTENDMLLPKGGYRL